MSDELLPYYNRELNYIRRLGAEFAEANPKIAARLRLSKEETEDPHVSRLIEAFAYLTARIRHKLDDDLPEITDAMLGVLYPHYQAPIPSSAIVQFTLDRSEGELTTGYALPPGSMIETAAIDGEPCRFRSCYPVTVWPIELSSAELVGRPFTAPVTRFSAQAAAVLRIELRTVSDSVTFDQLSLSSLRLFLHGQDQHVLPLFELIHNNVTHVALAASPRDPEPVLLPADCIRLVGFERDEALLPYSARSMPGYRLLTEYFTFPEKFLFFELSGIEPSRLAACGRKLEVYLYLNRTLPDLERNVSADMLRLGCTPAVNLFPKRAAPIRVTETASEYHVIPDVRRRMATEVYSVDRVVATSPDGQSIEYQPFYSFRHATQSRAQRAFWYATRRPAGPYKGQTDHGTDVWISLVDLDFDPLVPTDHVLDVETTCLNRNLPGKLHQPRLSLAEGGPVQLTCLAGPTPTRRAPRRHGAMWRLISHLTLNHLSISDLAGAADEPRVATRPGPAAEALREMLLLYDFTDSENVRSEIESIVAVSTRRVVGRVGGEVAAGFARGIEIAVDFDEERIADSGVFLLACVLERFLGLYCSINSFSKLVATTRQREGILKRWPPRAGEKTLL